MPWSQILDKDNCIYSNKLAYSIDFINEYYENFISEYYENFMGKGPRRQFYETFKSEIFYYVRVFVRLGCNGLLETNTLAYYENS